MKTIAPKTSFDPVHALLIQSISVQAVMAAVELNVFDFLGGDGVSAEALANRLSLVPARLEPVLDILVAADILEKKGDAYRNTLMADEFLVTSSPLYQGLAMRLTAGFSASVEDSIVSLLSGEEGDRSEVDLVWSSEDTMEGTAQESRGSGLFSVVQAVTELTGFAEFEAMCDIGGNHASFTMGILEKNPSMKGVVYDLPHVAEKVGPRCERFGFGDRIEGKPFDFRKERLPAAAYDLALTSHLLYCYKDDLNEAVQKIGETLKPGGWFVSHHYAKEEDGRSAMTVASLELLTRLCGYPSHFIEREEMNTVLAANGFETPKWHHVPESQLGLVMTARKSF